MSKSFFSVVDGLIKLVEKILVRIVIVGLVLLVTVQIILTNPGLEESLISKAPVMRDILTIGQDEDFKVPAKTVFSTQEEYLIISLQNNLQLAHPEIIVNGRKIGNFAQGYVKVSIKEGDKIAIDTRGLKQGVWFKITGLSTAISPFKKGQQFWVKDEYRILGRIKKINKF